MSFNLKTWLAKQFEREDLDLPVCDVHSITPDDRREWLVSNGLGSFASGCISGANTRKYHGLFLASLKPPTTRHLLLSRIDEQLNGVDLATNLWEPADVSPRGFEKLVAFSNYPLPTWAYKLDSGYLIKQILMLPGKQQVLIGYSWVSEDKDKPAKLDLHLLLNDRDFHGETHSTAETSYEQQVTEKRLKFKLPSKLTELHIAISAGDYAKEPCWYLDYSYPREAERGLGSFEDAFHAGVVTVSLEASQTAVILVSLLEEKQAVLPWQDYIRQLFLHQDSLQKKVGNPKDSATKRLILAADQFVVWRNSTSSQSVIAGYHWFNDWGRDSMISLPGLALACGRQEVARSILSTFQGYLSEGMLPNNFPDTDEAPHYNTVDAALWWAWAIKKYFDASKDISFAKEVLPHLESVVEWHKKGTRYNIRLDAKDSLITAGAPGVQLTWMDAKCGDYVVTPRRGKPVEISALWYNLLKTLEELHQAVGSDGSAFAQMAEQTRKGFQAFWNIDKGCLYDVINEDGSKDDSVRPNQLMALSLRADLLNKDQALSVLSVVESELLTSRGLRSLSPKHPSYKGRYGDGKASANQYDRDITYHQGTVWAWLFGPWVDARMSVQGSNAENISFIKKQLASILQEHLLNEDGLGSVSEIFDGDEPHKAQGCIAQAWSVAELLRVLNEYPELRQSD